MQRDAVKKYFNIFIILIVILLTFASIGCISQIASVDKIAKSWVGHSIEEIKQMNSRPESYVSRIGWKEKTYQLEKGNWVYVEPSHKDCFIHWEINPQGIIVGSKLEGGNCH